MANVQRADTGESAAFVLERFEVFTADATITVHGAHGEEVLPPPANVLPGAAVRTTVMPRDTAVYAGASYALRVAR